MNTIKFEEIKFKTTLRGKCKQCGDRCQQTIETLETVNPFNRNSSGEIKTYQEVEESVFLQHEEDKGQGVLCRYCRP